MKKLAFAFLFLPSLAMAEEPSLPMGLGDGVEDVSYQEKTKSLPFDLTGFVETRLGVRTQEDKTQRQLSIGEGRFHVEALKNIQSVTAYLDADFVYDPVFGDYDVDIEAGKGWFDLRQASLLFRPSSFMDVKAGRQILTWGTGDLLFINDMFSKDWNSFFIGRDQSYLKAPSDAVKIAFFHDWVNMDVVYTPRFDADRYIDGHRISYYSGGSGAIVGRNEPVITDERQSWFSEDEISLRMHRMVGAYEAAFYFYDGYWKSPNGQHANGTYIFPELTVSGASLRGPLAQGIANVEFGYYDSCEDRDGTNPLIRNSEWRWLLGYEQELAHELTGGIQYYVEVMDDYEAYKTNLPAGSESKDEYRHVITTRLTQMLMNQNLTLSLFNFYSPSDRDGYLRPKATYKMTDSLTFELGGNWFYGADEPTFFGQFSDNSNVYASVRFGF